MAKAGNKDTPPGLRLRLRGSMSRIGRLKGSIGPNLYPTPYRPAATSSPAAPVDKLPGKNWVPTAFKRRRDELLAMTITRAGRVLSIESKTAPDCAKPLSVGYCTNELRKLGVWPKKLRKPQRQRPK